MFNIAIFASGSGSNAENIINHFQHSSLAKVVIILTNNPKAGVIDRANRLNVPVESFTKEQFVGDNSHVMSLLRHHKVDYVILAGFLWLVPQELISNYRGRIINIHPALLPKYGGRGMYGHNVHQAVVEAREKVSGITIHHVNEHYDSGDIIAQFEVNLSSEDSALEVAAKIHILEQKHFPAAIEQEIVKHQVDFR